MKRCPRCGAIKPFDQFFRNRSRADGRTSHCKVCRTAHDRLETTLAKKSDNGRKRHLLKKYGLTAEAVVFLWEHQNHQCAACKREIPKPYPSPRGKGSNKTHIDHCHVTGVTRGLLCPFCNHALGFVRDNPKVLLGLIAYLRKYAKTKTKGKT